MLLLVFLPNGIIAGIVAEVFQLLICLVALLELGVAITAD